MPPVARITSGVKVPCSTCRIHSLYCFFFSFSFTWYNLRSPWLIYCFTVRLKTLTSKTATWSVNQKPRPLISTLAWSDIFAVFSENDSPFNGCSWVLHRHLCKLQSNVVFRIWLWCKVTNPPFGHWRACCKLDELPHAQWLGIHFNLQQYLIDNKTQKICLFGMYPSSLVGRVLSQEDTPVSRLRSCCFLSSELVSFFIIPRIFFCRSLLIHFICFFLIFNSGSGSCLLNWSVMRLQSCSHIMIQFWYSILHTFSNIGIPNPPSRDANDNSFLLFSVIIVQLVIPGIHSVRVILSTFNSLPMPGLFSYNNWICAYHHLISRCMELMVLFLQFYLIHEVLQPIYLAFPWAAPKRLLPCVWMLVSLNV